MNEKDKRDLDKIRQMLDDMTSMADTHIKGPEADLIKRLALNANNLIDVLASKEGGPGGESAFVVHHDSPSPLVTCDGVAACCKSDSDVERCPHSKPHARHPGCGTPDAAGRCACVPPPLGVCK